MVVAHQVEQRMGQQIAKLPALAVTVLLGLRRRPGTGNDDIAQHAGMQLRIPLGLETLFAVPCRVPGGVAHRGKAEHIGGPVHAALFPVDLMDALVPGQQHMHRAGQHHALRRQTAVRHQRKRRVGSRSALPFPFNPHIDPVPPKAGHSARLFPCFLPPPRRFSPAFQMLPILPSLPFPPVLPRLRSPARKAPRSRC